MQSKHETEKSTKIKNVVKKRFNKKAPYFL